MSHSTQPPGAAQLGPLLGLPHEVLISLFMRLPARALGHLAATCRLLQYGQSSPQTPSPLEDALRLRAELRGWSRTLPVDSRGAVNYFLRLAWQDDLEFHSIAACHYRPISFFVDSGGSLRACGVELPENEDTEYFLEDGNAAQTGSLGFGHTWPIDSAANYLRLPEPTPVPAAAGVRMRSVATGASHCLALGDEGRVYMWGNVEIPQGPRVPTLFKELEGLRMVRVAAGTFHSAAITDEGKLFMWWDHSDAWESEDGSAAGAGYPPPPADDATLGLESALRLPTCVEALAGMRVVSVAAGYQFTIVTTDQGRVFSLRGGPILAHGSSEPQLLPREIKALCGIDVASVCAGQSHILALTYTGGVYSWGEGDHYQALGHGTAGSRVDMVPQRIEALRGVRVRCIAVGAWHSCAVTEAGHMYTWGLGVSGALGNTNYEDKTRPKRVKMLYDKGVFAVGVVAGTEHTLVANADRAVWGFGSLNAIGVGESPALKRLLDRVQESRVQGEDKDWSSMMIFSEGMDDDTFDFLFPGEHCNISVPMRIRSSTYEARVLLR